MRKLSWLPLLLLLLLAAVVVICWCLLLCREGSCGSGI
jgi:hypothetical protein